MPARRYAFASGGADNVKKFKLPQGTFLHNFLQQPKVGMAQRWAAECRLFTVHPLPPLPASPN